MTPLQRASLELIELWALERTRATDCPGGHAAPTSLPCPTTVERGRGS